MSIPVERIIKLSPMVNGQWSADDDETLSETGFYWRERDGVKVLVCLPLEQAGFVNGFSTRLGGVSLMRAEPPVPVLPEEGWPKAGVVGAAGGENGTDLNLAGFDEDSAENIHENRRRFLNVFDGNFTLATAWQVHGNGVKIVKTNSDALRSEERFDALVSDLPRILAGVKTADCVPVLIGDPKTKAFAAVHAGWRGSVQSIASKAIESMKTAFGSNTNDFIAAIGPAASGRNYEIGREVIDSFESSFSTCGKFLAPTREGHALIDLHRANRDQIISSGVNPANIYTAPFCTMERTDLFFSYRVEKKLYGKTGRLLSVIGRR